MVYLPTCFLVLLLITLYLITQRNPYPILIHYPIKFIILEKTDLPKIGTLVTAVHIHERETKGDYPHS